MRYAIVDGERAEPTPKARGTCELCESPVYAKCGSVVVWHWAHVSLRDCDPWFEGITQWHLDWQNLVPLERREVKMGRHRADMVTSAGTVVEIQHSYLPEDAIRAREEHYGNMIWIFDAREAWLSGRLTIRWRRKGTGGYWAFEWKHGKKTLDHVTAPLYLDCGDGLILRVMKIRFTPTMRGWVRRGTAETVIDWFDRPAIG